MSTTPRDSHDDPDAPQTAPDPDAPPEADTAPGSTSDAPLEADTAPGSTPDAPLEADAAPGPETAPGQHAAPRPYPPSVPERRPAYSLDDPLTGPRTDPGDPPAPAAAIPPAPSAPPVPPAAATAPVPPLAPTTPVPTPTPAPVPAPGPAPSDTAVLPAAAAPTSGPDGAATPTTAPPSEIRSRRDIPDMPAKPGFWRHLLGVLVGLLVTPVALLLVGVGVARLADIAGTVEMGTDALGLGLLLGGVALLAAVLLLGTWSPAVPISGGAVWGIALGTAYLWVPNRTTNTIESVFGEVPAPAEQLAETAMSGYLVVVGTLLLAAGIAIGVARRRGRRWAEQVAAAERARVAARPSEEAGEVVVP